MMLFKLKSETSWSWITKISMNTQNEFMLGFFIMSPLVLLLLLSPSELRRKLSPTCLQFLCSGSINRFCIMLMCHCESFWSFTYNKKLSGHLLSLCSAPIENRDTVYVVVSQSLVHLEFLSSASSQTKAWPLVITSVPLLETQRPSGVIWLTSGL